MEIPGQSLEDLPESLKGRGERGGRDELAKEKEQGSSEKKLNGTMAVCEMLPRSRDVQKR